MGFAAPFRILTFSMFLCGLVFNLGFSCIINSQEEAQLHQQMCTKEGDTEPCSGRGICNCGWCKCEWTRPGPAESTVPNTEINPEPPARYTGQYCECAADDCPYSRGQVCGGPDRGMCRCGTCQCLPGYTGEACGCEESVEKCMAQNGMICNGRGTCHCGQCVCEGEYRGETCEECPTCTSLCHTMRPCVICSYLGEECLEGCDQFDVTLISPKPALDPVMRECKFADWFADKLCVYRFQYALSDTRTVYMPRNIPDC